jgi:flagellum-specific peptidoglycan hydrolase FlgJ
VKLNLISWLIWAIFPLFLTGATYQHATKAILNENSANLAAINQIHHDSRVSALVAFMEKHHFAQDQYQYVNQIIKDADSNKIPAAFLVCVDFQESSGGQRYYRATHNPFGWGSDQISFASERVAIDYISRQLGSGRYYAGKSIAGKLRAYNPDPEYAVKIINCINQIK